MKKSVKKVQAQPQQPKVTVTRETYVMRRFLFIEEDARCQVARSAEEIQKWSSRLESDPVYAFEWSADSFKSAAKIEVARTILALMEDGRNATVDEYTSEPSYEKIIVAVRDRLLEGVVRKARWPDRSTSPQSNDMSLCINAEMAEWLETVTRFLSSIEEI